MKIYTKMVHRWVGDELVLVEEESYDYDGPVAEAKGGSSGDQYYENLNRLYGLQADQAEMLMGVAQEHVIPAYTQFLDESRGYGSMENREQAATEAMGDARASTDNAARATADELISMGIDPSQQKYASTFGDIKRKGIAVEAGAATTARRNREQMGFARQQDAISLGMGIPTQATSAAAGAANSANSALAAQNQQNAAQGAAWGNIVRGGIDLYGYSQMGPGKADGGLVEPLRLQGGGYVQKMAAGGFLGGNVGITPPPPRAMPRPSTADQAAGNMGMVGKGLKAAGSSGKLVEGTGNLIGNSQVAAYGKGMNLSPEAAQAAGDAYRQAATQMVNEGMTSVIPEAEIAASNALVDGMAGGAGEAMLAADATAAGTSAATAAELGGTAAALEGGAAAATALGTAVPVIGAGLALYGIGKAADWWADGGSVPKVTPGAMQRTGEVDGPGGPKDDLIPAMLSDGEFVFPRGTVLKYGLAKLEKMRQEGLQYEQQLGIGKQNLADGGRVDGGRSELPGETESLERGYLYSGPPGQQQRRGEMLSRRGDRYGESHDHPAREEYNDEIVRHQNAYLRSRNAKKQMERR